MHRRAVRINGTRRTREHRPHHDSVGAQHAAPAEETSGPMPREARDVRPTSFSDLNSPHLCAVRPHA